MPHATRLAVRAPGLVVTLSGQALAGVVFSLTFRPPVIRPIWMPQFFVLLILSTALLLLSLGCRRNVSRVVVLAGVIIVDIVLGIPEGPDLAVVAILGTVFIFIAMTEVRGPAAYALSLGCSAGLAASHWPLVAWGALIPGATPVSAILLAAYFLFLTWLSGIVGHRGQQLLRQHEEMERIDRTVRELSEANLDFQELATRVQRETEEQERKRIAREIHDIVGYTLTNIQMMMEAATDLVRRRDAGLHDLLLKSRDQAQRGLMETRRAMRNLRAVAASPASGMKRVAEAARLFEKATRVRVKLNPGNAPASFGPRIDDVIYRMIQECFTNSLRHGKATEITVNFWCVPGAVRISVADNGAGSGEIVPGVGLAGMTERIGTIGGTMKAGSTPFGFLVFTEIPLVGEDTA